MVKVISAYSLPNDQDPEKFWKYHTQIHAEDVKKAAGPLINKLKRYTINRVEKVDDGEANFFGFSEMWWEDESALKEFEKRARNYISNSGKNVLDDFESRAISVWRILSVEVDVSPYMR